MQRAGAEAGVDAQPLSGRAALVLGGASGIGLATAWALLQNGADVVVGDVSEAGHEAVEQLKREFGAGRALFVRTDVCDDAQMEAAFNMTKKHFQKIDILVNSAGIFNDGEWNLQLDINTKGTIRGCLLAWKFMGKHEGGDGGVVVNIASIAGLQPLHFSPLYTASKFAVVGLGRSLGMSPNSDRTGVRVLTICPGATVTMIGMRPGIKHLMKEMGADQYEYARSLITQKPDNVANAVLHAIQHGESGSVWVSENGEPAYQVPCTPYAEWRDSKSVPSALSVKMALEGQVALVVGGASGIGRATAREMLRQGASVALGDVSADAGEEAARQLRQEFGAARVSFLRADVCNDADMEAAFVATKEQFKRLDIFVNAAGIINDQNWNLTMDVNTKGVIRGSLLAWKHMGKHEGGNGGAVVNIASIAGLVDVPFIPIYCTSKIAVIGFGRCLGMQYNVDRTGVRIFTVCPGITDTPILKMPLETLLEDADEDMKTWQKGLVMQQPENVAKAVLHVIQYAESGSAWVSENGDPAYEVSFPNYTDMCATK